MSALARACFCRSSFSHQLTIRVHRAWSPKFVGPKAKFFFQDPNLKVCWLNSTYLKGEIHIYIYIYLQLLITVNKYKQLQTFHKDPAVFHNPDFFG